MSVNNESGGNPGAPFAVPYDPELIPSLEGFLALIERVPLRPETIAENREILNDATVSIQDQVRGREVSWENLVIPGLDGDPELEITVVRPNAPVPAAPAAPAPAAPAPAVLSIHGGGMILGSRFFSTAELIDYAEGFGAVGVSVEYRLAPEAPGPAQARDCYAALVWLAESASELGVDPERIVVAGVSAGGGLAAAVGLMARDLGGPRIAGVLMSCPMLDARNAQVSTQTVSSRQYDGFGAWDRNNNVTAWNAVAGGVAIEELSPYASPSLAKDLSGLPPVFVDVGAAETFRDEAVEFAARIARFGGVSELHVWAGGHHGFPSGNSDTVVGAAAIDAQRSWLRRVLATRV